MPFTIVGECSFGVITATRETAADAIDKAIEFTIAGRLRVKIIDDVGAEYTSPFSRLLDSKRNNALSVHQRTAAQESPGPGLNARVVPTEHVLVPRAVYLG